MEQVRKPVPPGAFKDKTLSDGTKISAMDAFTVADAEAAFTAPLDAARREGGYGGRFIPRAMPISRFLSHEPGQREKAYNEICSPTARLDIADGQSTRSSASSVLARKCDAQGRTYLDRAKDILSRKRSWRPRPRSTKAA